MQKPANTNREKSLLEPSRDRTNKLKPEIALSSYCDAFDY